MKIKKKSKTSCVGVLSGLAALSLVTMAMVFPEVDGAFAKDCTGGTADSATDACTQASNIEVGFEVKQLSSEDPKENPGQVTLKTNDLTVNFVVNSFIEISQDPEDINIAAESPSGVGHSESKKTTFAVRTNSAKGFTVSLKASDVNLDGGTSGVIGPIATDKLGLSSFGANTWGVAVTESNVSATEFRRMTSDGISDAYTKTGFSESATPLDLHFATRVTDTLPAGTYGTTVTVSATLNPAETASLPGSGPVAQVNE